MNGGQFIAGSQQKLSKRHMGNRVFGLHGDSLLVPKQGPVNVAPLFVLIGEEKIMLGGRSDEPCGPLGVLERLIK